ncbi:MAG: plasmid maintenance system antidote protein [Bacteroidales bacterium]|nr:plasmid maintenance system antidote protein [Bacteroidales bacterium]
MKSLSKKYKGIHPGIVLGRELLKRGLKQRPFSMAVGEFPQTFNAIIKGKRNLPTSLALKIEKELGLKEGELVVLQAYFDIEREKLKLPKRTPNLQKIRKSLFWDTDVEKLDWESYADSIIKRVFERGNKEEKEEITRFYGMKKIEQALSAKSTLPIKLKNSI